MRTNHSLSLAEARQRTPKVDAVEAMKQQLQIALFGAVSEKDVLGVAEKLKSMALEGNLKAMKLFFDLVANAKATAPAAQVVEILQALNDLQQTVASLQQAATVPTEIPAGSPGKVAVIEARVASGLPATVPGDAPPLPKGEHNGKIAGRPRIGFNEE